MGTHLFESPCILISCKTLGVLIRHDLLSIFALIVLKCLVISNMAIMKLDIFNLMHFLTFRFIIQLAVKGFVSKFRVCSFSYQTLPTFPHFMCGMFGHAEYRHW